MIDYRCGHCGERIPFFHRGGPERLLVTITTAACIDEHFCSIRCATMWAEWAGYHKPPIDDVVDAEIYCGSTSESESSCRFVNSHHGDHISYKGEVWSDA